MNITDLLDCRYLKLTDDIDAIGELLYLTDPFIYPTFFGSRDNAVKIMREAICRGSYCFSKQNIFCAFWGNKPVAMICKNPDGRYKWDYQEWRDLFFKAEALISDSFDNVAEKYFLPMNNESFESQDYLLAVCVLPEYRSQQVGTYLLDQFLKIHSERDIVLDTLEDNTAGMCLYKKFGFAEYEYYLGYSESEPYPHCVRMIRNA